MELRVFLWSKPSDDAIVVEVQHLQGDRLIFEKYAGFLLDAASGRFVAANFQPVTSDELNVESLKSAEEIFQEVMPTTTEQTLESFGDAMENASFSLKSDRMDVRIAGMEQLCFLSDPRQTTRLGISILTSRAILFGVESILGDNEALCTQIKEIRHIVITTIRVPQQDKSSGDGNSRDPLEIVGPNGVLLNLALTVLKQALEVLVFLYDIYSVDSKGETDSMAAVVKSFLEHAREVLRTDLLSVLVEVIGRASQEPHSACLSAMCLRLIVTASGTVLPDETKSQALDAASTALEYGQSKHAKLEAETRWFIQAIGGQSETNEAAVKAADEAIQNTGRCP